jgi:hypothetical protein
MKKKYILSFLILFLLHKPTHAFDVAGLQPLAPNGIFSTFSAESLPKNKMAVEMLLERSREPDFYRATLKAAYGLSDNLEFIAAVPYVLDFQKRIDGIEDIAIGFKHRLNDETKFTPSLAYILTASIPSGRDELGTDGRFGLGFILSKRIAPFQGNLNLFYAKPGTGKLHSEISMAAGVVFSATHNSELLAEFIAKKGHFADKYDQLEARMGYRMRTTDTLYTTVGIGTDFRDRTPEYRLLLSVSYSNAKGKKKIKRVVEEEQ